MLSVIHKLAVLKGDVDNDESVNNLDITPFIGLLAAAAATAVPKPSSIVRVALALMMGPRRRL